MWDSLTHTNTPKHIHMMRMPHRKCANTFLLRRNARMNIPPTCLITRYQHKYTHTHIHTKYCRTVELWVGHNSHAMEALADS